VRLWQKEAAVNIGVSLQTYRDWEKGRAVPYAGSWRLIIAFLGYDPSPLPTTLGARLKAKRRELGLSLREAAERLGWDPETIRRYEKNQCGYPGVSGSPCCWPLSGSQSMAP
jgi:transcriptional regulator with XRE-family HTH domain